MFMPRVWFVWRITVSRMSYAAAREHDAAARGHDLRDRVALAVRHAERGRHRRELPLQDLWSGIGLALRNLAPK